MTWILADAHVHLRSLAQLTSLAQAAQRNFLAATQSLCPAEPPERVLFLTESADEPAFAPLARWAATQANPTDGLSLHPTAEKQSLRLTLADERNLHIIGGRQIVTQEGIEVLALGHIRPYGDGLPMTSVLRDLAQEEALLVLPWGVGKWLGHRGEIIARMLAGWQGEHLFVGDNGNRPRCWPLPASFRAGAANRNLPGSDPLPLPGQEERVGSYGFACQGAFDHDRPFHSLATLLRDPATIIRPYGRPERFWRFCTNQARLRLPTKRQG